MSSVIYFNILTSWLLNTLLIRIETNIELHKNTCLCRRRLQEDSHSQHPVLGPRAQQGSQAAWCITYTAPGTHELQFLSREGAKGFFSSLGLRHTPPAEQAHSGSFGKGRTLKNKLWGGRILWLGNTEEPLKTRSRAMT